MTATMVFLNTQLPRRPPSPSRMYTGASVLTTQSGRFCLPRVSEDEASPSPPFSLTHVHRFIGSHNTVRQILPTSPKLTYLSMYDSNDGVSEHAASPSPPSSLTHVHRCIGSHNTARQILPTSPKLTYLSMYDSRNDVTQCIRGI
jgi:hypothetical protein